MPTFEEMWAKKYSKRNRMRHLNNVTRLPSGIFVFDLPTKGGFPEGRISTLWGVKSSHKTTLALKTCSEALLYKPSKKAVFIDIEGTLTEDWTRLFVVEQALPRFIPLKPETAEEAIDVAYDAANSDDITLVIMDSMGMLHPVDQIEESSAKGQYSGLANMVTRLLTKICNAQRARPEDNQVTFIGINQPTTDISSGAQRTTLKKKGGQMQELATSLDIRMSPAQYYPQGKTPVAAIHKFVLKKNKVGLPEQRGEFTLILQPWEGMEPGEIDDAKTLLSYAKRLGLLVKEKSKYEIGDHQFNNQASMIAHFRRESGDRSQLREAVLATALEQGTIEEDDEED